MKRTFNENLNELLEFVKKYNRLPGRKDEGGARLRTFILRNKDRYTIANVIEKYRKFKITKREPFIYDVMLKELEDFCKSNNRLPNPRRNPEESRMNNFRIKYKNDENVKSITEKYRVRTIIRCSFDEYINQLTEFVNKYNRKPKINNPGESRLAAFMQRYADRPEVRSIDRKYRKNRSFNDNLAELIEFCKTNQRLPRNKVKGDEDRLYSFIERNKMSDKVKNIYSLYKTRYEKA